VHKALISIKVSAGDPAVSETLSRGAIGPEKRHELVPNVEDEEDRRRTPSPTVSTLVMTPPPIVHRSNEPLDVHGYTWHREKIISPIGGPVHRREWCVNVPGGRDILPHSDFSKSRPTLEYFLALFPLGHLSTIVAITNENLISRKLAPTTPKKILKFFGVMLLSTRFEFSSRESLLQSTPRNKYLPALNLGVTGMTRDRFRNVRSAIRFSEQGEDTEMSSSRHRWSTVTGFVDAINAHWKDRFHPSDLICVDKPLVWFGRILDRCWTAPLRCHRPEARVRMRDSKLCLRAIRCTFKIGACCVC
jgi:hypothetical protein